ncbi:MAG TPA: class II aldolase/adducin family protein [Streptosporangiaceae bacterium]
MSTEAEQRRTARDITPTGQVAEAARVLARLGLVTAYGHVSARSGDSMLITLAADLGTVEESDIVTVPLAASALPPGAPAEAWVHLALYRVRADAGAIARAQPPSAFAVAAATTSMAPLHGQAAWLGECVPVHDDARLLRSADLAGAAVSRLPAGEALLLRGNGAITLARPPVWPWPGCGCWPQPATPSSPPRPRPPPERSTPAPRGRSSRCRRRRSRRGERSAPSCCPGCGNTCAGSPASQVQHRRPARARAASARAPHEGGGVQSS